DGWGRGGCRAMETILGICGGPERKMREGTAPAAATGRELRGRRTTEQYLSHSRRLAPQWRHPIALWVGIQTRNTTTTGHPRTISSASPLLTTPGAKIVQETLWRRLRGAAHNSD